MTTTDRNTGWGWNVSKVEREREIADCERAIALYDILLKLDWTGTGIDIDDASDLDALALATRASSEAMGLSEQDARDLADAYEADPEWLPAGPSDFRHGRALQAELEARFFEGVVGRMNNWKSDRAAHVRRRSAARRAIADGRAS